MGGMGAWGAVGAAAPAGRAGGTAAGVLLGWVEEAAFLRGECPEEALEGALEALAGALEGVEGALGALGEVWAAGEGVVLAILALGAQCVAAWVMAGVQVKVEGHCGAAACGSRIPCESNLRAVSPGSHLPGCPVGRLQVRGGRGGDPRQTGSGEAAGLDWGELKFESGAHKT